MSRQDSVRPLRIASPCTMDWDLMSGNDRVRFCEHCQLSVHNIDLANGKQLKRLIARSGGRLCVSYRQPKPPDKSAIQKLHRIGRRASAIAAGAFSATLSITTAVGASANPRQASFPNEVATATHVTPEFFPDGSAKLYGIVYDPNGAVISGAAVTATNTNTGQVFYAFTGGDGQYRFERVTPGSYILAFSLSGFDTSSVPNFVVRAGDNNRLDHTLGIAPVEAEVNVVAETLTGAVAISVEVEPIVQAAANDDLEAVQTILLGHVDANLRDKATRYTALEHAVQNGNREMVQVLLWAKADINARDNSGQTVLMQLGESTTAEIVWDLINNGAKIDLHDDEGDTALISVAEVNNVEALKVLLDAGAKVNQTNKAGRTALMIAAEHGLVHNVRALILGGANVNARDREGKSALMYALENNEAASVRLLKSNGAIEFEAPNKQ